MAIHLDRQRPPTKKMGRKQRRGSKSNPRTGVQWANWLDFPGSGGGGGSENPNDPFISSISPSSVLATAGATTITVTGARFQSGCTIEFDQVAVPTTFVNDTTVTTSFDPSVAKVIQVTVRQGAEESNSVPLFVAGPLTTSSVAPNTFPVNTPTLVTITGTGFIPACTVWFGSELNIPITFVSPTSIKATLNASAPGNPYLGGVERNGAYSNDFAINVTATADDPTSSWLKADILNWLVTKGVIVDASAAEHFTKAELLEIVAAYLNDDQDAVDGLLGS